MTDPLNANRLRTLAQRAQAENKRQADEANAKRLKYIENELGPRLLQECHRLALTGQMGVTFNHQAFRDAPNNLSDIADWFKKRGFRVYAVPHQSLEVNWSTEGLDEAQCS